MISCVIENGNGGHVKWESDTVPSPCPFTLKELCNSSRVTMFSEDYLVVLSLNSLFVSDLVGPEAKLIQIDKDRETLAAMILCALHPDGETDWDYADFEEVIERLGLMRMRFIP